MGQAREVASTAAEHAGAVKEEAKGKAVNVAHDVRRELQSQGDAQAKRAASALHGVGDQLRSMAASGQPGAVTDFTRQAADKTQQMATRLENDGMRGVGDDLANFARRQPVLFLAAAGLAGFLATRVMRSAASNGSQAEPMGGGDAQFSPVVAYEPVVPSPMTPPSPAVIAPADMPPTGLEQ